MASDNRTEQATPRRRQKAREQGQVVRSRELSGALAILTVVVVLGWQPFTWRAQWQRLFSQSLDAALSGDVSNLMMAIRLTAWTLVMWVGPTLALAWALAVGSTMAQGGFLFSANALKFDLNRLNPATNLGRIFSIGGLSQFLKSLVPMGIIAYLAVGILSRDWDQILASTRATPRSVVAWLLSRMFEIAWKSGLVFLGWSVMDYLLQKFHYERSLRMARQEVKDDTKETEGNPQIKGRVRRLQRQMRRRFMIRDVAKAAVVITNPTHYAVALEYRPAEMEAPRVVAKGKNLLAERIKQEARWHTVPIMENPPLAQALYRGVEVGQAIPPALYAAVAEILAFIFKAQGRAPATPTSAGPVRT